MLQRVAVVLALAVGAVGAGQRSVISVGETKGLIPIGTLPCVPLYEVRSVKMTVCRMLGSERQRLVTTATVVQNKTDNCDLIVTLSLIQCLRASPVKQNVRVPNTRKGEPIAIRFVSMLTANLTADSIQAYRASPPCSPHFAFETVSPEPPK